MTREWRKLLLFVLVLSIVPLQNVASCQTSQAGVIGAPQDATMYQIPGVGFVNLNNGNLHMEFPLWTVKDRNGTPVTSKIIYDNSIFQIVNVNVGGGDPHGCGPNSTPGCGQATEAAWAAYPGVPPSQIPNLYEWQSGLRYSSTVSNAGTVTWTSTYFQGCSTVPWDGPACASGYLYSNWEFIDSHNTVHPFPTSLYTADQTIISVIGGFQSGFQASATDGSGYWLKVSNQTNAVVYDLHGNIVYGASGFEDTNGNIASQGKDLLGRPAILPAGFQIAPSQPINIWTNFGSGPTEIGTFTAGNGNITTGALQREVTPYITLPDGRSYQFQYDDAGPPNNNGQYSPSQQGHYGSLTGVTLPTGGQITIQSEVISYPPYYVVKSVSTPDGTWSFSYPTNGNITATAPVNPATQLASQTTCSCGSGGVPQTVSVYAGTGTGAPLRTIVTQYSAPSQPSSVATTLDSGQTSTVTYTYWDTCTPRIHAKKEYDFSNSLVRETDAAFYTSTSDNAGLCSPSGIPPSWNDSYLQNNHHIVDIPQSVTIYGSGGSASGTPIAQTTYTYDSTTLSTKSGSAGNSVLGLSIHDDSDYGAAMTVRGNLTQIQQLVAVGNAIATKTNYYNILGEVVETVDGNSYPTNFDYTDSWNDSSCISSPVFAYPTTVTNANSQTTKTTYNSCDGSVASAKDPNNLTGSGIVTSYDSFQRPHIVTYPDGGSTSYDYGGSSVPKIYTTTIAMNSSQNAQSSTTLDSLGRKILDQLPNGAFVGYGYDPFGRLCAQSNPTVTTIPATGLSCSASANASLLHAPTDGITYSTYDALGRSLSVTHPGGTSQSWQYSSTSIGPKVLFTDENGSQWSHQEDALGRLVTVLEPNGTTQSPTMETDYGYDALNNLISVKQWGGPSGSTGARVRSFNYDLLSRLLCASNPENSSAACPTTNSGYVAGTVGYTYDADGNVKSKTDARGVVIGYSYDTLNRLLSKTYSGNVPAGTLSICYQYDTAPTNGIGRLGAEWTSGSCSTAVPTTLYSSASPSGYQSLRVYGAYDAMGRASTEQQCVAGYCTTASVPTQPSAHCPSLSSVAGLQYCYDLAGNLLAYSNGVTTQMVEQYPQQALLFAQTFDAAGRLNSLGSSWSDATHPQSLFASPVYTPFNALSSWLLGTQLSTTRTYDNRLRVTGQSSAQ